MYGTDDFSPLLPGILGQVLPPIPSRRTRLSPEGFPRKDSASYLLYSQSNNVLNVPYESVSIKHFPTSQLVFAFPRKETFSWTSVLLFENIRLFPLYSEVSSLLAFIFIEICHLMYWA